MDKELRVESFSGTWVRGPQEFKGVATLPLRLELVYESKTFDIGDQDRWGYVLDRDVLLESLFGSPTYTYRWFKLRVDEHEVWIHSSEIFEALDAGTDSTVTLVCSDEIGFSILTQWRYYKREFVLIDIEVELRETK